MDPLAKLIGKPTHMSMDMDRHRPLLWVPQEQSNKSLLKIQPQQRPPQEQSNKSLQPQEQSKKSLLTSQPQQRMVHSASRR